MTPYEVGTYFDDLVYEEVPPLGVGTTTLVTLPPFAVCSIVEVTVFIKGAVGTLEWIIVSLPMYEVVVDGSFVGTLVGVVVLGAVTVELVCPLLVTV